MKRVVRGLCILVVEDDELTAMSVEHYLTSEGARVVGLAETVEDAHAIIASEPHIDVAYVDMKLRGASAAPVGDALVRRRVPFVVVTATPGAIPERLRFQRSVTKPAALEKIADALASAAAER